MIYLISSRQLTLKLNLPDIIYHEVDKLRIRQVIANIISNAIKNTPTGGAIYISANENPEYLDIQIRDMGVGLTHKEKEKLFEKFGKIERYGKGLDVDIEGSGLGLFISKHIVNLHNGEILVESEGRNKGATFTIRLYKK
jgi:signal transduction histidine kinase